MKKTRYFGGLDLIAKCNGYDGKFDLLRDYGFIPTVMVPKHKKIEIIALLWKHINNRKR